MRGVEAKATRLEERLDVICIGVPHTTAMLPREAPNPMSAAYLALGLALRLWRDEFPVNEGGTAILLSRFTKRFRAPDPAAVPRTLPGGALEWRARSRGSRRSRAVGLIRRSRDRDLPRGPLVPPAAPVRRVVGLPARDRAARCRARRRGAWTLTSARQLGFVPTHGIGPALAMAHGRASGPPRIGYLLSPPYFPIRVG